MTPRQRIESLLAGRPADRVPFCPAVYEHKAALIGTTPSLLSRDPGLFERALIREAELYRPDMLVVGCDVYNVEAEAVGGKVRFYDSSDVPSIAERPVKVGDDISRLRFPDPEKDGRMPVCLEAGGRIQKRFGREMFIRGALSAPFSIACELAGAEEVLMALLDDPAWVSKLLSFSAEIAKTYGRAYVERGLGIILFDSHAAPPLVSPSLYRSLILPPTADVVGYFREALGLPLVPYIIGGDTSGILEAILETGTNNILCDFRADLSSFVDRLENSPDQFVGQSSLEGRQGRRALPAGPLEGNPTKGFPSKSDRPVLLRANLDPRFLLKASIPDIQAKTSEVLAIGRRHPGFILGTGILPFDLPPEKVMAVRAVLE
ncbi:MAG: uroporphyrinogen decarboxylase family protein [Candidatus Aminicenantes bacterium]|nr:uroporphyrinogen decarboxylase family protein [Candidatus Aminicenantes bacterium]